MNQDTQTQSSPSKPEEDGKSSIPCIAAESLFRGTQVVLIEYQGERYQLRRTRAGKLILTK